MSSDNKKVDANKQSVVQSESGQSESQNRNIQSGSLSKHGQSSSEKCINCMKCTKGCPIILDGYSNPKDFISAVESGDKFYVSDPFSCLSCGFCKSVCPKDIDIQALIYEHKKDWITKHKEKSIKDNNFHKKYSVVESHQKNSFRVSMIQAEKKDRLFFPGCALTGARFELVSELSKDMDLVGIGSFSGCCGSPYLHVGDENSFNESTKKITEAINKSEAKEVIVACSNCLKAFERITSAMEKDIKITSLYSVIDKIVPKRIEDASKSCETYIIHDPCPTRNNEVLHEDIRELTRKLNLSIKEFELNRKNTTCCGDGGMASVMSKTSKNIQLEKRVTDAGENPIISYCQSCVSNFKSKGNQSVHILEMIYPEIVNKEYGTLVKWLNRYKYANYTKSKGE